MIKIKDVYGLPDSYTPCYRSENRVSRLIYMRILTGFFKYIFTLILEGKEVILPQGFGSMYIRGKKFKPRVRRDGDNITMPIDWVQTKAMRESNAEFAAKRGLMYHLNEHSSGLTYAIRWIKKDIICENISFFSFKLARANKRALSAAVKNGAEYLVEVK